MKEKIKTTSFWLGFSSAIVLIVDCVAGLFGVDVSSGAIEDVLLTICSVLVVVGFVTKKTINDVSDTSKEELLLELKNVEDENQDKVD